MTDKDAAPGGHGPALPLGVSPGGRTRPWVTPAADRRPALLAGLLVAGTGIAWGLLWWGLAPTAKTVVQDGGVYLQGHQELMVGQDGWFVVLGAIAGALLAVVWPMLTRPRPVAGIVVGLVGCVLAGLVAWGLGSWLGPSSLRDQLAAGVKAPITPLALHTPAALLFAPMLFAVVRGLVELLGFAFAGIRTEPPAPATSSAQSVQIQQGQ